MCANFRHGAGRLYDDDAHAEREVRRREQEADPRLAVRAAVRHRERRAEPVRRHEAELPRGDAVAAPATSTAPSRESAGAHPAQSANGSSGWQARPAAVRLRARARRAAASASAPASSSGSRPVRVAAKNARYGCCVGCAKWRLKRWTRIAVPPSTIGNASRQSRSACPSPSADASSGFGRSRGRCGVVLGMPRQSASSGASRGADRSSIARRSASACATEGGPAKAAAAGDLAVERAQHARAHAAREHGVGAAERRARDALERVRLVRPPLERAPEPRVVERERERR